MAKQKWKVYTLDVIGSNDKGWEVNDVHPTNHIVVAGTEDPFAELITNLKLMQILNPDKPNCNWRCEWIGEAYIEIDWVGGGRYAPGKPSLQLRKVCNKCLKEITGRPSYCSKDCVKGQIIGLLGD